MTLLIGIAMTVVNAVKGTGGGAGAGVLQHTLLTLNNY